MSVSVIGSDAYRLDECGWQADRLGPAMIAILVEYRNLGALRAWYCVHIPLGLIQRGETRGHFVSWFD